MLTILHRKPQSINREIDFITTFKLENDIFIQLENLFTLYPI